MTESYSQSEARLLGLVVGVLLLVLFLFTAFEADSQVIHTV